MRTRLDRRHEHVVPRSDRDRARADAGAAHRRGSGRACDTQLHTALQRRRHHRDHELGDRFFEKPSVIRKRKKAAKVRKSRRQTIKASRAEL